MRSPRRLSVLLKNSEFQEQCAAFGSHFVLNCSLLILALAASIALNADTFARFSLASNYVVLGAMLIDFGMNGAAMKLAIERSERRYVQINVLIKGGLFIVCLFAFSLAAIAGSTTVFGAIAICSAGLALWYSLRSVDQYERQFKRLAGANVALAALRLMLGVGALLSGNWMVTLLAVHVAAIIAICSFSIVDRVGGLGRLNGKEFHAPLRALLSIAPPFFVVGASFSSIPVVVQTAIYLTDNASATGAFGLVMLLTGGLSLIVNTLRIYVQPQIIHGVFDEVKVFGLGRRSLHVVVVAYVMSAITGLVLISLLFQQIYRTKFPEIGMFVLVYGTASCVADVVGIYNMRSLRGRLIVIASKANLLRLALVGVTLLLPQFGAFVIVVWASVILALGEILLFGALTLAGRQGYADGLPKRTSG